jgi:hypothetical protein
MPISIINHDHTVGEINASNPLPVQIYGADGRVDISDVGLLYATGTTAAAGLTALVGAPGANVRIVVSSFMIQNESTTATTVIMQEGGVPIMRALLQTQGAALSGAFLVGREWKLPANTALNLNLSAANSHGYSVVYYTEPV